MVMIKAQNLEVVVEVGLPLLLFGELIELHDVVYLESLSIAARFGADVAVGGPHTLFLSCGEVPGPDLLLVPVFGTARLSWLCKIHAALVTRLLGMPAAVLHAILLLFA